MVTRLKAAVATAFILLQLSAAAQAEHLVMPYACRIERGRVTLSPAPERSYAILGARSERPFTWCPPGTGPCRIRMVHRFDLSCDGARVPWLAVASAAARTRSQTLSIENGRLRMATARSGDLVEDCAALRPAGSDPDRACRLRPGGRAGLMVANLPAGFAPLNDLGARIVFQPPKPALSAPPAIVPATATAQAAPAGTDAVRPTFSATAEPRQPLPSAAGSGPPQLAAVPAADPVALILASADKEAARSPGSVQSAASHPPGSHATEIVSAEAADADGTTADTHGLAGPIVLALLLGTVLVGAGWQGHKRLRARVAPGVSQPGQGLVRGAGRALVMDQEERACLELGRTVEQLVRNADDRLAELTAAAPLRGVLRQELDLIRMRLAESLKLADRPKPAWRQLRTRLQSAIRELHRIVRIAEGAIASFSGAHGAVSTPKSREEAYDVLGVNADVSETVLKKVVDALRMSWHPDLARGEEDRLVREERTKIINVAWDLISGKRAEA